jgi:riboflavin biosynthesis pyrimidine reductase
VKVILIGATTICGRINPVGYGSLLDRRRLEEIRDETQASLMGANTLRQENPEMRGTNNSLDPKRIRAIISQSGNIPVAGKKLFKHGPSPVVFTAKENASVLQDKLQKKALVVGLPAGLHGLSMQAALDFFGGRGVESLLIEGGAHLNFAALADGVVDEILLTIMPYVSGEQGGASFANGPTYLGTPFLDLELLSSESASTGELFLHYRVKNVN